MVTIWLKLLSNGRGPMKLIAMELKWWSGKGGGVRVWVFSVFLTCCIDTWCKREHKR